jgi:hypothetical protein
MKPTSSLVQNAYRRVDLDARIEGAAPQELARICIEEAIAALQQSLLALERDDGAALREPLVRAQGIAVWLSTSVAADSPLREPLTAFYRSLAGRIARNLTAPSRADIEAISADFGDVLNAASTA